MMRDMDTETGLVLIPSNLLSILVLASSKLSVTAAKYWSYLSRTSNRGIS